MADMNELVKQLKKAIDDGDFKQVAAISREIAKGQVDAEKAEADAKRAKFADLTARVLSEAKKAIETIYTRYIDEIDKLGADGLWIDYQNGDIAVRVVERKARTGGGGGGAGKRYNITTEQMLAEHGNEIDAKAGKSWNDVWAESTEKNHRYQVRTRMLKAFASELIS